MILLDLKGPVKKRDFDFTRESHQMFPMMSEWEYCGWLFLKGSNQHCVIDQNLLKWNENIDPLVCLHFCGDSKVTSICRSIFSMHYCIKSHSYVNIRVHFPARKIQEHGSIQKTLSGWSFCSSTAIPSSISMPLLKKPMWNMF